MSIKNSGKKLIPQEQPNQNKGMKIADSVLFSLFMRDNEKCNISHALSGIQCSILNVLESLIPKNQKKYDITETKLGQLFTAATQHLTH